MTALLAPAAEAVERARMDAVHRYDVLDSPPDRAFDRITALAARLFEVPVSLVSIVDTDRIWLKSTYGLPGVAEIPRTPGLCASVVLQDDPWVVTDAEHDPRTRTNPLVSGEFGLRFYLGIPLRTHDGHNLGSLSVIDTSPRDVTPDEVDTMVDLAQVVVDELELRLAAHRNIALQTTLREAAEEQATILQEALLPPSLPRVDGLEIASRYRAEEGRVGGDFYDVVPTPRGAAVMVGDVCGKGARAASFTATARWSLRTLLQDSSRPADTLGRLNTVLTRSTSASDHYCTVALGVVSTRGDGFDLRASLGGHPPLLVLRRDGRVDRLGVPGPIVGWLPGGGYTDSITRLQPGETVVLYTDGLLDAVCGRGASSDEPLVTLLGRLAGRTAEQIAGALDLAAQRGGVTDDVAIVVLRAVDRG
ncbi:PP2C family protein-serine/threonine phosphatase [Jatrophihabitans sp. YIM 134969]